MQILYVKNELFLISLTLIPTSLVIASLISIPFKGKGANYVTHTLSILASLLMCFTSLSILLKYIPYNYVNINIQFLGTKVTLFRIDYLSAFFVLVLGIVALNSSIYGLAYVRRFYGKEHVGWYGLNYPLFILSMYLTIISWNLIAFIIFWELMTVTSQYLVSYEKSKEAAIKAGFKYFCITKLGAEAIIVSVMILIVIYSRPTLTFSDLIAKFPSLMKLQPFLGYSLITLFTLGLLIKAAVVPFHSWLPDAHPEAPSNVSALLSGVMIKVPIYVMVRMLFQVVGPNTYVGFAVATLGVITLLVGTLYALEQVDSKRLLAYHSVGQIGYIVLALGSSIVLLSLGTSYLALATVAYIASMYHLLNHAVFKSLLFLTAGSVIYRTGSRDLNRLGGLGKYMPVTAATALIASLSIAGIPPFNGFVSKWLIYVSTMCVRTPLVIYGVLALFISAVTTASFIKYFTAIFGRGKREVVGVAKEVPPSMYIPQLLLAFLCVVLGVIPPLALTLITPLVTYLRLNIQYLTVMPFLPFIIYIKGYGVNAVAMIATYLAITTLPIIAVLSSRGRGLLNAWLCGSKVMKHLHSIPGRGYYIIFEEVFREVYVFGKSLKGFSKLLTEEFISFFKYLSTYLEKAEVMTAVAVALVAIVLIIKFIRW